MNKTTTILVSRQLKKELDSFKEFGRETYADVIRKLVHRARQSDESGLELSKETIKAIEAARNDIKEGRVHSSKKLAEEMGF